MAVAVVPQEFWQGVLPWDLVLELPEGTLEVAHRWCALEGYSHLGDIPRDLHCLDFYVGVCGIYKVFKWRGWNVA